MYPVRQRAPASCTDLGSSGQTAKLTQQERTRNSNNTILSSSSSSCIDILFLYYIIGKLCYIIGNKSFLLIVRNGRKREGGRDERKKEGGKEIKKEGGATGHVWEEREKL